MSETTTALEKLAFSVLEILKEEKNIEQKLQSPLRDQILIGEINKITDIEDRANRLLEDGVIDIYAQPIDLKYKTEIEYLRIKANYYRSNVLPSIDTDQEVVIVYATHIF